MQLIVFLLGLHFVCGLHGAVGINDTADHPEDNHRSNGVENTNNSSMNASNQRGNLHSTPSDNVANKADNPDFWEYTFTTQPDQEKWYWISFPVLDRVSDKACRAYNVFKDLLHTHIDNECEPMPTYLGGIWWSESGRLNDIRWLMFEWTNNKIIHTVSSTQGYKLQLLPRGKGDFPSTVNLHLSGTKASDYLEFPIYGGTENWLGYFLKESQLPENALASIWDDVLVVKTKSWCLIRSAESGKMVGKSSPLNYGDMVVVVTRNNHNFVWNSTSSETPVRKPETSFFSFAENQDYIPLIINLKDGLHNQVEELSLNVRGVCKGAVVVDDDTEQISAYLTNPDELQSSEVELGFYINKKGMKQRLGYLTINPELLHMKYGVAGSRARYYTLDISRNDFESLVAPQLLLCQNYPNPFNPSTTISYQLPTSSEVRLEIYNLKCQLVKTLVNARQDCGYHNITWNGTDSNNKGVASGVYFYRLCSSGKNVTRKMLLMK